MTLKTKNDELKGVDEIVRAATELVRLSRPDLVERAEALEDAWKSERARVKETYGKRMDAAWKSAGRWIELVAHRPLPFALFLLAGLLIGGVVGALFAGGCAPA